MSVVVTMTGGLTRSTASFHRSCELVTERPSSIRTTASDPEDIGETRRRNDAKTAGRHSEPEASAWISSPSVVTNVRPDAIGFEVCDLFFLHAQEG
jgi:hypothetical protein